MGPILCNYYLTYRCNARCSFCDIWRNPQYKHIKDAEVKIVIKRLKEVKSIGVRFIDFTGGEPLLYNNLPKVLQCARELKFITSITTNCLLYPQRAKEIKGLISFLHFSLDSMNSAQHDNLRGVPTFDKVMESIEIALSLGEKPDLLFTVTEENFRSCEKLVKFAQKKRLILIINPVFKHLSDQKLQLEILGYLDQYQNKSYVYVNRAFHRFRRHEGNQAQKPRCRAVSSTVVISPQNELLLPCFHFAIKKIKIETELVNIRRSKQFKDIENMQGRYPFCSGCVINCYFDPSFAYSFDLYTWLSLISKAKYILDKYIRSPVERYFK